MGYQITTIAGSDSENPGLSARGFSVGFDTCCYRPAVGISPYRTCPHADSPAISPYTDTFSGVPRYYL